MDFLIGFLNANWYYAVIGLLCVLLFATTGYILVSKNDICPESNVVSLVADDNEVVVNSIRVDVKGAVKKPGVYEFVSTNIINDAINAAGGFTSKAYSKNINLSKKTQ